jgi:hypothetical protein
MEGPGRPSGKGSIHAVLTHLKQMSEIDRADVIDGTLSPLDPSRSRTSWAHGGVGANRTHTECGKPLVLRYTTLDSPVSLWEIRRGTCRAEVLDELTSVGYTANQLPNDVREDQDLDREGNSDAEHGANTRI